MPGYGHAVASNSEITHWNKMIKDYINKRNVLSLCCILIDCTRGLCSKDKQLIKLLIKYGLSYLQYLYTILFLFIIHDGNYFIMFRCSMENCSYKM